MQDRARAIFYPKGQSNNQKAFIPTLPEDTAKTRRLKNKTKKKAMAAQAMKTNDAVYIKHFHL